MQAGTETKTEPEIYLSGRLQLILRECGVRREPFTKKRAPFESGYWNMFDMLAWDHKTFDQECNKLGLTEFERLRLWNGLRGKFPKACKTRSDAENLELLRKKDAEHYSAIHGVGKKCN